MMKKINLILTLIIVLSIIFACVYIVKTYCENKFFQETIDKVFMTNLSSLCDNLNIDTSKNDEEMKVIKENIKYSHLCFSIFSLSSYSENTYINETILALYNLSEKEVLHLSLDSETICNLNKWKQDINNEELLEEVYKKLVKK